MAGRGTVGWCGFAEFAAVLVGASVIGVIDEVGRDDSRPIKIENRHGEVAKQKAGGYFELVTLERVQPVHDSIVAGRVVRLRRDLPDGRLINAGHGDDWPDIAGIEGRALDSSEWKLSNYVGRYIFDVCCRKYTVWIE